MSNKVIIAAAGSGKTTFLVNEALKITDEPVLITTFTDAAEKEIRNKFGCVPPNITVQTWFSALLQHGVRPYQNYFLNKDIKGMILVSGQSALYTKENTCPHYFDANIKIYSDKLVKFALKCNLASGGKVIDRLSKIYAHIFIDEVQDLSGYDFEFLELLFSSNINTLLVGDPRQGTYSTSNSPKNRKYAKSNIVNFFVETSNLVIDDASHTTNHRSIPAICDFSNKLFPAYPQTQSGKTARSREDGLFLVHSDNVAQYLERYQPMQLRHDKRTNTDDNFPVMNFGQSKGCTFDRVLIYPTGSIKTWLKNNNSVLAPTSRSKLYVAITRARYSVAFVYDYKATETIAGVTKYIP